MLAITILSMLASKILAMLIMLVMLANLAMLEWDAIKGSYRIRGRQFFGQSTLIYIVVHTVCCVLLCVLSDCINLVAKPQQGP